MILTVFKVGATFVAIRLMKRVFLQFGKQVQRLCFPSLHPSVLLGAPPSSCWGLHSVPPFWMKALLFVCAGTYIRQMQNKSGANIHTAITAGLNKRDHVCIHRLFAKSTKSAFLFL